jgi:hypothetical protein
MNIYRHDIAKTIESFAFGNADTKEKASRTLAALEQARAWETIGESARSIAASIDALCNALATKR